MDKEMSEIITANNKELEALRKDKIAIIGCVFFDDKLLKKFHKDQGRLRRLEMSRILCTTDEASIINNETFYGTEVFKKKIFETIEKILGFDDFYVLSISDCFHKLAISIIIYSLRFIDNKRFGGEEIEDLKLIRKMRENVNSKPGQHRIEEWTEIEDGQI